MKISILIFFLSSISLFSITSEIKSYIGQVNLDSLIQNVRILSGEDSVLIDEKLTLISHRVSGKGNDLAALYIKQKIESFGLSTFEHDYRIGGKNIYAIQIGSKYPEKKYIICAHYDSVTDFCADDNASGVSTVLEAARILSNYQFDHSIIYALWDEEEIGLIGSRYFAEQAKKNNEEILGVINFDMLGWDEDDDGLYDIHSDNNSQKLVDTVVAVNKEYDIPLYHRLYNPGVPATDHASFADQSYPAITFGEAFFSGDDNIHYHKSSDRISEFNTDYYFELSQLAIGVLASLAYPSITTDINNEYVTNKNEINISNYPNPFSKNTQINYSLSNSGIIKLSLYDLLGNELLVLDEGFKDFGNYSYSFDKISLNSGSYFIILKSNNSFNSIKINKMP